MTVLCFVIYSQLAISAPNCVSHDLHVLIPQKSGFDAIVIVLI